MIYEIDELKDQLTTVNVSYAAFITAIDYYAWEVFGSIEVKWIDLIRMYFDETLENALLQGEPDWLAYSDHGNSLVSDESMATRFGCSNIPAAIEKLRNLQVAALERTPAYLHARAIYYYTHNN